MMEPRERIAEHAADYMRDMVEQWYDELAYLTESPAELNFLVALQTLMLIYGEIFTIVSSEEEAEHYLAVPYCTVIRPQANVTPYRVDFLLTHRLGHQRFGFAIEVDGHEFHERTKKQASRDKARDRFFLSRGYRVVRFSGSDVWNDPMKCAEEVYMLVDGLKFPPRTTRA